METPSHPDGLTPDHSVEQILTTNTNWENTGQALKIIAVLLAKICRAVGGDKQ